MSTPVAKKARTGHDKIRPHDPKREAFEAWLRSRGAWWAEDLVAVRSPDHQYSEHDRVPVAVRGGWGLMSRGVKIKKGTVLCRIPKTACLTGADGFASPESEEKDSQLHLAMRLLIEWDKGASSDLHAKLETLPKTENVCWAWPAEERALLVGTELQEITERKRSRLEKEWRGHVAPMNPNWDFPAYIDAAAAAISHANPWFGVCMVSMVDMGNWGEKPDVEFDQEGDEVVGKAIRSIPAHAELTQSYGDTGAADLLYRYGFMRCGPGAFEPTADDTVSFTPIALFLAAGARGDVDTRVRLLEACSVIAPCPWDGMEDVLTVQLCVKDSEVRGLCDLRVAMAVLTTPEELWAPLVDSQRAAATRLLGAGLSCDDSEMVGLCVALQTSGAAPDSQAFTACVSSAEEELRRAGYLNVTIAGSTGGVEGGAERSRSEGDGADAEQDDSEDESEELDWADLTELCGGSKEGSGLPWLETMEAMSGVLRALQTRREMLMTGASTGDDAALSDTKLISEVDRAAIELGEGAVSRRAMVAQLRVIEDEILKRALAKVTADAGSR